MAGFRPETMSPSVVCGDVVLFVVAAIIPSLSQPTRKEREEEGVGIVANLQGIGSTTDFEN